MSDNSGHEPVTYEHCMHVTGPFFHGTKADLAIGEESIYTSRRQDRVDRGLVPGLTSAEKAELVAARRRIAQLETELVATRRAAELLRESADPKGGSRRAR